MDEVIEFNGDLIMQSYPNDVTEGDIARTRAAGKFDLSPYSQSCTTGWIVFHTQVVGRPTDMITVPIQGLRLTEDKRQWDNLLGSIKSEVLATAKRFRKPEKRADYLKWHDGRWCIAEAARKFEEDQGLDGIKQTWLQQPVILVTNLHKLNQAYRASPAASIRYR